MTTSIHKKTVFPPKLRRASYLIRCIYTNRLFPSVPFSRLTLSHECYFHSKVDGRKIRLKLKYCLERRQS